jgi:hypothetical protein
LTPRLNSPTSFKTSAQVSANLTTVLLRKAAKYNKTPRFWRAGSSEAIVCHIATRRPNWTELVSSLPFGNLAERVYILGKDSIVACSINPPCLLAATAAASTTQSIGLSKSVLALPRLLQLWLQAASSMHHRRRSRPGGWLRRQRSRPSWYRGQLEKLLVVACRCRSD